MDYSEECRSQLVQGPLLRVFPGAARSDDLRSIEHLVGRSRQREPRQDTFNFAAADSAFEACRAELSLIDKLKILGGEDCGATADFATRYPRATTVAQSDDFESDSAVRTFVRLVLWRCECLYYQMLGQWIGQRVDSFKQTRTGRKSTDDRRCSAAR